MWDSSFIWIGQYQVGYHLSAIFAAYENEDVALTWVKNSVDLGKHCCHLTNIVHETLIYLDCQILGIILEEGTYVLMIILRDTYMMMSLGCTGHVLARMV
jgi:hypothetical protein